MKIEADKIFYDRISPRSFKEQEIDDEALHNLFEAARWAASSYNEQPWRFIYGNKNEQSGTYEKLLECLDKENRKWANTAPILMLTIAKTSFDLDGSTNPHAMHDLGLAMGNFTIQATNYGIMIHQMAGFDQGKAKELFQLPKDHKPVALVAIGYSDEEKNDRKRKPLENLILNPS